MADGMESSNVPESSEWAPEQILNSEIAQASAVGGRGAGKEALVFLPGSAKP